MSSKVKTLKIVPFEPTPSHDREAHEAITGFLADAVPREQRYPKATLDDYANGARLAEKDPQWNRRCVIALVEQDTHWYGQQRRFDELRKPGASAFERMQVPRHPAWPGVIYRRCGIRTLAATLLRRKLPLTADDLAAIAVASAANKGSDHHGIPPSGVVRQAEAFAEAGPLVGPPADALAALRDRLREDTYSSEAKLAARIDRLLHADAEDPAAAPAPPGDVPPPAPAGSPGVLVVLKRHLGMLPPDEVASTEIAPDAFPIRDDSPLRAEHESLTKFYQAHTEKLGYLDPELNATPSGKAMGQMSPAELGRVYLAACERAAAAATDSTPYSTENAGVWQSRSCATALPWTLAKADLAFDRDGLFDALLLPSAVSTAHWQHVEGWMIDAAEATVARIGGPSNLTPGERHVLHRLRCACIQTPPMGVTPDRAARLSAALGESGNFWLVPGEAWADAVHASLSKMSAKQRAAWCAVLQHAAGATSGKPSAKWLKAARGLIKSAGKSFSADAAAWLAKASAGRSLPMLGAFAGDSRGAADTFNDGNATVMRGLAWMLALAPTKATPRAAADLLATSIKKVPGVGPRAVKVANGCVWSLGEMAGSTDQAVRDAALAQLARLRARVTFKTTLKEIDKALDRAAAAAGVSREELDELGLPTFGFDAAGVRAEDFGEDFGGPRAELRIDGLKVVTTWTNEKGKIVKSPPAAVRKDHAKMVKELKAAAKDAEGILLAQRDRFDALYLQQKTWPLAEFRDRVLGHPLAGAIARRLIWTAGGAAVLFNATGGAADVGGKAVNVDESAEVSLWHPVGRESAEVLAWRRRLEALAITQPFKQAHREVYVLTDAERATGTYSNRFAGHVLKQHQFNALCAARGWQNQLRLMVDDEYAPPTREVPAFGLRAEYWVEGAGEDCTDAGTYLYLATDQVRFYHPTAGRNSAHAGGGGYATHGPADRAANHPLPLDQIPPLALSELLRDVDLFVGVASVGNDPAWQDGGPDGRFRTYWQGYSFGDLSATAQTRKTVLEKLVPRLKIAGRAEVRDKWLVVRGDVRTYKIHLGSGNILMEPNDEYLCIVPSGSSAAPDLGFLPFEGDRTLSVILSKAFLLAEDKSIKDRTILSQIRR